MNGNKLQGQHIDRRAERQRRRANMYLATVAVIFIGFVVMAVLDIVGVV